MQKKTPSDDKGGREFHKKMNMNLDSCWMKNTEVENKLMV